VTPNDRAEALAPEQVADLLERLAAARSALAAWPLGERALALGRVADLWLGDEARLAAAAEAIAAETGYAPPMVAELLEATLRQWRAKPLRELIDVALADPHSIATPPDLVVAVLAQNTPGLAIAPTFTALALGSAVLLKCSHGEARFAPLLVRSLREVDATLGGAAAARLWRGGDALEAEVFAAASRVVVYGPDAAIERARVRAGERVIACGPRVSAAVVASLPNVDALARALARDVAFLDQRGCLSPQVVLVSSTIDCDRLARALAEALERLEREWPRRSLSLVASGAFRRAVDEAEARVLAGEARALHGGVGRPWAVVVEEQEDLLPSPLDRFVRLHPFRGPDGLSRALAPLRGRLECIGLAADPGERAALAEACRAAGASRICGIGAMQDPPADWHAGARRPVSEYLSWSTEEGARTDAETASAKGAKGERFLRFVRFVAQTSATPRGIEVVRARGSWVEAADGRRYLDLLAGIGVAAIGHAHPRVAAAVAAQATRFTHVMVYGEDVLAPQVDLAERLASLLPPSLQTTYFTNSGAEAIEGALKLVRKATGRARVVAFEGAYHGDTTGALALGGNPFYREPYRPLVEPVEHLPWDDAAALDRIDASTAAVFVEPVQAEGGVRVPSPEFLPRLRRRCSEVGALLVFDEVVTGLGRTGRWFGFEHWPAAMPDVLVLAKPLGGGLPLGAFVSSHEILRVLADDPPLGHVTTFGGNPVACAAGLASLGVLAEEDLPARAARVGERFRAGIARLAGRGRLVAVRGIGLLLGLEFDEAEATAAFVAACRERGVLLGWTLHHDRVVRLAPPLTIAEDEIELALAVFAEALG